MPMFKPKATPVEARQWDGTHDPNLPQDQWDTWITVEHHWIVRGDRMTLIIINPDGSQYRADAGDWIVQQSPTEFEVHKPGPFGKRYEAAGAAPASQGNA